MVTTSFVLRRLFTAHTVPDVTLMPSWPALACGLNGWVCHEPSLASLPRSGVGNQQYRARDPDPSPVDLALAFLHAGSLAIFAAIRRASSRIGRVLETPVNQDE